MEYIDRSALPNAKRPLGGDPSALVFTPKYILHALYSFDFETVGMKKKIKLTRELKCYETTGYGTIGVFIQQVIAQKVNGTERNLPRQPSTSPFDIGVDEQCHLVVELDRTCNWIFSQTKTGITQKSTQYPDDDGPLNHVDPDNGSSRGPHFNNKDCRVVHFEVRKRADHDPRYFDFNVRILESNFATEIIIDPDIPNTGSSPFPPGGGVPI